MTPTTDQRPGISGVTMDELAAWVEAHAEPSYRARQVADAVWKDGGVTDSAAIRTLPAGLRDALTATFRLDTVADTEIRLADAGQTEKALHRLAD